MLEGSCQDSWCVDLTFMAPDESGRVYHVLIDMERQEVARTFYTRGLAERTYSRPAAQQISYNDGCREQYGWSVCWEMTAHDGINFYDASYIGRRVFSTAKISQVEVFYPAWPGGYRDEIGFGSTVPPYFGTNIRDLGNGFEVQQLYTEFLRWPNCICCYRYEQIIRFYADGTFEPRFISHGPGCDDDSVYRPFWRIDMDLTGPESDEVWYWEGTRWHEAQTETRVELFDNISPDEYQLFTSGGGLRYYWKPIETDPSGIDEGRLYLLRFNEEEGVGPITTGPADTFYPPQRWLDDEELFGENFVVWYIPILNTRWEDPYWCVPDPDPNYSPCEAILRVEPGDPLVVEPTIVAAPTAESTPETAEEAGPTATPRPIAGEDAASITLNAGCGACHQLNSIGLEGEIGPDLSNAAEWAGERVEGLSAAEYIRQSILEPDAFIAPECPEEPCRDGIMPDNYAQRLTEEQIDAIVNFLVNEEAEDSNSGFSLPPSIGQNDLPLGASSGGAGAEIDGTADAVLIIISTLTILLALGLVVVIIRRRNGQPDNL
jgi:mono/diheme cytochrome c family protein